jgi:membrane fusion protein, peptide pheromone/bacteriocin exporter
MKNRLFPEEIIENSQESNFSAHSVRSRVIYTAIVVFVIGVLGSLPFIYVDVGVRSQGLIRPVTELIQLAAPVSGHIQTLNTAENSFIRRGEIFAVLEAPQLTEQLRFNKARQEQLSSFLNDLNVLQYADSSDFFTSLHLTSPRYQRVYLEFRQQLQNQKQEIDLQSRSYHRDSDLFKKDAISEAAFDETHFAYQTARNNFKLLIGQQQSQWKLDEITFQNELDELQSEYTRLQQELTRYKIRSPVSGTVQNMNGIFKNSFVYANQILGEISPDTSLVAEVYVSPRDIGLLKEHMPVRLQIDAYNHSEWGVASGHIKTISSDVITVNDQPHFRVRCTLDQTFLELPSGFKGEIKKGMTFNARFIVNRRNLFQLLYDKADDWLNPGRAPDGLNIIQTGN